ncbi:MAG: PD-(D/E)XK nuclease family protein [Burkholderiales bacterium]|jgi:hypothetical protein|nr:PD-(D/E)XK nuclease family protein [Burkholderiales bacterium]
MSTSPVIIRASSFGSLFDCPARWIAINLEGRQVPQNGKAALGTALHTGTAVFDGERAKGQVPSVSAATDAAVEAVRRPSDETDWDGEQVNAEKIAASLTEKYCREESDNHFFVAVEVNVEALHLTDLNITLTGTADRVAFDEMGYGVCDIKSGKQIVGTDGTVRTAGHAAQLGVYELVAEAATGLEIRSPAKIIGLQTNLTPEKQRIGVGEITGAREVLLGDADNTGLLTTAASLVHGAIPPWGNPKSMMCHVRYCPNFQTCFWRK